MSVLTLTPPANPKAHIYSRTYAERERERDRAAGQVTCATVSSSGQRERVFKRVKGIVKDEWSYRAPKCQTGGDQMEVIRGSVERNRQTGWEMVNQRVAERVVKRRTVQQADKWSKRSGQTVRHRSRKQQPKRNRGGSHPGRARRRRGRLHLEPGPGRRRTASRLTTPRLTTRQRRIDAPPPPPPGSARTRTAWSHSRTPCSTRHLFQRGTFFQRGTCFRVALVSAWLLFQPLPRSAWHLFQPPPKAPPRVREAV